MIAPKREMRFEHPRFLAQISGKPAREWPAQICRVTSVRGQDVYYRAADEPGKATHRMALAEWESNVRTIVQDADR